MEKQANVYSAVSVYAVLFPFYGLSGNCLAFCKLTEYNVLEAPRFVGLNNYKRLFLEDTVFKKALGNTVVFAVVTGPVGIYYLIFYFVGHQRT